MGQHSGTIVLQQFPQKKSRTNDQQREFLIFRETLRRKIVFLDARRDMCEICISSVSLNSERDAQKARQTKVCQ